MSHTLELTSRFDDAERAAIFNPLIEFNHAKAGDANYIPLNVLLRDQQNNVVGGLWGHTAFGWLCVELLYFPQNLRGKGFGRTAMTRAETEAITRGCQYAWLDTHEFQSKAFYEALGYTCFGELADYPNGFARYFMRKNL